VRGRRAFPKRPQPHEWRGRDPPVLRGDRSRPGRGQGPSEDGEADAGSGARSSRIEHDPRRQIRRSGCRSRVALPACGSAGARRDGHRQARHGSVAASPRRVRRSARWCRLGSSSIAADPSQRLRLPSPRTTGSLRSRRRDVPSLAGPRSTRFPSSSSIDRTDLKFELFRKREMIRPMREEARGRSGE
jgi:hypothetical protein